MTIYIWQGGNIVAELNASGTIKATYTYGTNLISSNDGTKIKYYIFNAHGDVTGLANSIGVVIKSYQYDAFGNEIGANPSDTNPFRYSGQYFDKETGDYYLMARYYDPANGRFTQQDDWGYANASDPLSLNLYTYCTNDPVNMFDPTGHLPGDTDADPSYWADPNNVWAYAQGFYNSDGSIELPNAENYSHPAGMISLSSGIVLEGDVTERSILLDDLQQLTDDILKMSDNGMVYIYKHATGDKKYLNGDILIERLINSVHKCTIRYWCAEDDHTIPIDWSLATNGTGTDAYIEFNPYYTPNLMVYDTEHGYGYVTNEESVAYINLAHELIHADHNEKGETISADLYALHGYTLVTKHRSFWGHSYFTYESKTEIEREEEYATVGIGFTKSDSITENMIRTEHGMNIREVY